MAHHYPNIDSSLSKTTNSSDTSQQPISAKKLQTRNIRNNTSRKRTTNKQQQQQQQQISKQSTKEDEVVHNPKIPPPPPDIPQLFDNSAKNDTSQNLKDIINARKNLPRDMESTLIPSNPHDSMMKIIRSGVKLRTVTNAKTKINPNSSLSDNAHASLLKAVANISLSTQDSDSDDDHTW